MKKSVISYQSLTVCFLFALGIVAAPGAWGQHEGHEGMSMDDMPGMSKPNVSKGKKLKNGKIGSAATKTEQGHPPSHIEEPRVAVEVPEAQQEKMGLRTIRAARKNLSPALRTVGIVSADERKEAHVHSRVTGWIERVQANYVGKIVEKDQPLFDLYSPDIVTTEEEYLAAAGERGAAAELASAALERLRLWGIPETEILRLTQEVKSQRVVTFRSPVKGYVVEKAVLQGMYVTPEMHLYHIADISNVWVLATLYESDLPVVKVGDKVEVTLSSGDNRKYQGFIDFIYPQVDLDTRTGKARLQLDNGDLFLKPGMYVNVTLRKKVGSALTVPDDAVIDTGLRKIVFVKVTSSRFEPREVEVGPRVEGDFVIRSGLKEGEQVATGAAFLVDSESKLKAALEKGVPVGGHSGHSGK